LTKVLALKIGLEQKQLSWRRGLQSYLIKLPHELGKRRMCRVGVWTRDLTAGVAAAGMSCDD